MPPPHRTSEFIPPILEGFGVVRREDGILIAGRVEYEIEVWQHYVDGVLELREIEGRILSGLNAYATVGENLVLTLEDGRTLPFALRDLRGNLVARGPLARPTKP